MAGLPPGVQALDLQRAARRRRPYNILLVGDSISAWREQQYGVPGFTDNNDGTITLNFASDRGFYPGDPIRVSAASDPKYNVMDGVISSATGSGPVTYAYSGNHRTHNTTSSNGGGMTASRPYTACGAGYYTAFQFFARQVLNTIACTANGGKIAEIAAMVTDPKLGLKVGDVDLIIANPGTNDITSGRDEATMRADYTAMFDLFDKLAAPVAVLMIAPRLSSTSLTNRNLMANLNSWLWNECLRRGYRPIDTWSAVWNAQTVIDSTSTTAAPTSGMLQADGTHPDGPGALAIGLELWNGVKDLFTGIKPRWTPSSASLFTASTNLLGDTSFTAGGGTVTANSGVVNGGANVPSGWFFTHTTGSPTVACSLVPRSLASGDDSNFGNRFSMVFSAITGATNTRLDKRSLQALFTAGQKVRFRIPVEAKNLTALTTINARFWPTWGGAVHYTSMSLGNVNNVGGSFVGVLETPELVVPVGGFSACEVQLNIGFANGGSGQVDVWMPEVVLM